MKIEQAKALLSENGFVYEEVHEYGMTVLLIRSNNGKKDLGLEFLDEDGGAVFNGIFFGDFDYEYFDYSEDALSGELIDKLNTIVSGRLHVIYATNLENDRWLSTQVFLESDDPDEDEMENFRAELQRIEAPVDTSNRYIVRKRTNKLYEIYDWNSYRVIRK